MRKYIPIAEIESRDPEWAARIRERDKEKMRRLRAADPEHARELGRAAYARDPERHLARKKAWREANPQMQKIMKANYKRGSRAKYIRQSIRSEAKQKGVGFDIGLEWIEVRVERGTCELSWMPFNFDSTREKHKDAPSIDRIIPGGDYTEDNCRLILFGLNSLLRWSPPRTAVARLYELRGVYG